jgi:glucokinase
VHAGQLLRGAHGAAGEVAFLPLSPDYRRRRAASPDEAGGLILLKKAQLQGGWADDRPPTSVEELFQRAAAGEAPGVALVEEESRRIAAIAASICAIIDPETIILAGGVGANEALVTRTSELVNQLAPFAPAVVRSALGDTASLVGATALALRRVRENLIASLGEPNGAALSESLS